MGVDRPDRTYQHIHPEWFVGGKGLVVSSRKDLLIENMTHRINVCMVIFTYMLVDLYGKCR